MKLLKILVIDDEKLIRWSFEKKLGAKGHQIFTAESAEEGLNLFEKHYPDVVFVDNHLPGMDFPTKKGYYPDKYEVAAYLKSYVEKFKIPITFNQKVTGLKKEDDYYVLCEMWKNE